MEGCISTSSSERRSKMRYPVRLNVRYRTIDRGDRVDGAGLTVNISSSSLLATCQHEIRIGRQMEVLIDWPWLLDSTVPLRLVATGRVIRSDASTFALEFEQYQFRTVRSRPFPEASAFQQSA